VLCNLDSHDSIAREICRRCDAVVVSVDYRLAPEDPFPAAVDDAVWAVRWAAEHVAELGNDPRVLAVAGDSAGGNLSAVVAQQLRDTGGPPLAAQLLMYPVVDMRDDVEQRYLSMREHSSDGILLTADFMRWFQSNYATAEQAGTDPRCSPIVALDLSGLPDAVIVTAEYDPLRDSGEAYAAALADAGVKVDLRRFDSIIHGFFSIGLLSPLAQAAVEETCALFRDALRREA
jgi:acetyl esterase